MSKPVIYHPLFKRNFRKRIYRKKRLVAAYKEALNKFLESPEHPDLRPHDLRREMDGLKSFWVENDCRVIYRERETYFEFYDIGNHKEVY